MSIASLGAKRNLARLTTEPNWTIACHVLAMTTTVAVVLATSHRAILASVISIAQALTSVALAVGCVAFVGAHLDGAIGSLPTPIANARAIVAMPVAEAVVQADARVARVALPPMLAFAQPSGALTVAMPTAIVWARVTTTVLALPSIRTCASACAVIAKSMARAIVGANEFGAIFTHEAAVAFACVIVLHAFAVPRASIGASEVRTVLQQITGVARAKSLEARAMPAARVRALTDITRIAFPSRFAAARSVEAPPMLAVVTQLKLTCCSCPALRANARTRTQGVTHAVDTSRVALFDAAASAFIAWVTLASPLHTCAALAAVRRAPLL